MKKNVVKEEYINKIISESIDDYLLEEGKMQNFGKSVWNGVTNAYYGMKNAYNIYKDAKNMINGNYNFSSSWGIKAFIPEIKRYGKKLNKCLLGMNVTSNIGYAEFDDACVSLYNLFNGKPNQNTDFSNLLSIIDNFRKNAYTAIQQCGNGGMLKGRYSVTNAAAYYRKFSQLINQFEQQSNNVLGMGNYEKNNLTVAKMARDNNLTVQQMNTLLNHIINNNNGNYANITAMDDAIKFFQSNPTLIYQYIQNNNINL